MVALFSMYVYSHRDPVLSIVGEIGGALDIAVWQRPTTISTFS